MTKRQFEAWSEYDKKFPGTDLSQWIQLCYLVKGVNNKWQTCTAEVFKVKQHDSLKITLGEFL